VIFEYERRSQAKSCGGQVRNPRVYVNLHMPILANDFPSRARQRANARSGAAASAVWLLITVGVVAGCATDSAKVSEYLDQQTGVTVRSMASPFIYSRGVREAANWSDYISIGAVEVNTMGTRREYLAIVVFGYTVHKSVKGVGLTLGGQARDFPLAARDPLRLGIGRPPFRPPWGYDGEYWYLVAAEDLREFLAAPPDSIELVEAADSVPYFMFDRADEALKNFIRDIPDAAVGGPKGDRPATDSN